MFEEQIQAMLEWMAEVRLKMVRRLYRGIGVMASTIRSPNMTRKLWQSECWAAFDGNKRPLRLGPIMDGGHHFLVPVPAGLSAVQHPSQFKPLLSDTEVPPRHTSMDDLTGGMHEGIA